MAAKMEMFKLLEVIKELRSADPSMTLNAAASFLLISQDEGGFNQRTLAAMLGGVPLSTVSRTLTSLSGRGQRDAPGKAGLGWVLQEEDPNERRQNLLYLTTKGRLVAQKIQAILER